MNKRIPELDGLRGLAIFLVIICHYVGFPTRPMGMGLISSVTAFGWCGVDLFFVLSGFLIGGIIADHAGSENIYRVFYGRRAFRIVPLYLIALGCELLVPRSSDSAMPIWSYATFSQDIVGSVMLAAGHAATMGVLWSLAIEEKFYLALPFMFRKKLRAALPWIVVAIALASPFIRYYEFSVGGPAYARFLPFGRMDALFIGVGIALFVRSSDRSNLERQAREAPLLITLLGVPMLLLQLISWGGNDLITATVGYSILAICFAGTLLHVLIFPQRHTILRLGPLRWLGTVSYFVYLFHRPIWDATGIVLQWYPARCLVSLAVTLSLAAFSWKFVENPLIRRGKALKYNSSEERRYVICHEYIPTMTR